MQLIVHCLLVHKDKGLLLLKPRKNWFACPGGKIETYEHIEEAVIREYKEETNLHLINPKLKAVTSNIYQDNGRIQKQRMLFTFVARAYEGEDWESCREGVLTWIETSEILNQDMAPGDRIILHHVLNNQGILSGVLIYDMNESLVEHRLSIMND